jgi:SAM-dependent methyltransferase
MQAPRDEAGAALATLVLHLRASRRKARAAATAEALGLLEDLDPAAPSGGPLSELGGTAWVTVPRRHLKLALARLGRLGYTAAVDLVEPSERRSVGGAHEGGADPPAIRWRRRWWQAVRVHQADEAMLRERAPDRRPFLLECGDGQVREVRGYRGSGAAGARRALPVPDARMLVNLAGPPCGVLLDPFAGAGGIALEAAAAGWTAVTADVDPVLRFGLAALARLHLVADARRLPLRTGSVDAVATEPPYHPEAGALLLEALPELARTLRPGGRLALLVTPGLAALARQASAAAGLAPALDTPVDRKGLDVVALTWSREGRGRGPSRAAPAAPGS